MENNVSELIRMKKDRLQTSGVPFWLKLSLLLWWDSEADQPVLSQLRCWVPESIHRPSLFIVDEDLTILLERGLKMSKCKWEPHWEPMFLNIWFENSILFADSNFQDLRRTVVPSVPPASPAPLFPVWSSQRTDWRSHCCPGMAEGQKEAGRGRMGETKWRVCRGAVNATR